MWNTAFKNYEVKAPCYLKTFKDFLPQSLLGPFLNTLSQLATLSKEIHYEHFFFLKFSQCKLAFQENCLYLQFFCSVFPGIRNEYGDIRSIFSYSFQMRQNTDQRKSEYGHFSRSARSAFRSLSNIYEGDLFKKTESFMFYLFTY